MEIELEFRIDVAVPAAEVAAVDNDKMVLDYNDFMPCSAYSNNVELLLLFTVL